MRVFRKLLPRVPVNPPVLGGARVQSDQIGDLVPVRSDGKEFLRIDESSICVMTFIGNSAEVRTTIRDSD